MSRKIVVVVDDEPGLCEMYQDFLDDEGYDVRVAMDGAQGLQTLKQLLPDKPCIVICDVLMPLLDGNALYGIVKNDRELRTILCRMRQVVEHPRRVGPGAFDGPIDDPSRAVGLWPDAEEEFRAVADDRCRVINLEERAVF